jgi:hypothetical protein
MFLSSPSLSIIVYQAGSFQLPVDMSVTISPMSRAKLGDGSAQMIVLGLVVQQEDTVLGMSRRLTDMFPEAGFGRNAAHSSITSLLAKDWVHVSGTAAEAATASGRGRKSSPLVYAATPQGVEHFRSEQRVVELPPSIKNGIKSRLEFLRPEDVPLAIENFAKEAQACSESAESARMTLLADQRARRTARLPLTWEERLRGIIVKHEATLWTVVGYSLDNARTELEELQRAYPLHERLADSAGQAG